MQLKLEQDTDAQSPATWEGEGDEVFLVADHRDFFIPPSKDERRFEVSEVIDRNRGKYHVFILEAYIHSGIALALAGEGNFPDRQWDVSTLGAVFVSKSSWRLRKSARKTAESTVEVWNQYLSGDVWGCVIEDDDGEHIDSCWGFYGEEYARGEGECMLAEAQKQRETELAAAGCLVTA